MGSSKPGFDVLPQNSAPIQPAEGDETSANRIKCRSPFRAQGDRRDEHHRPGASDRAFDVEVRTWRSKVVVSIARVLADTAAFSPPWGRWAPMPG